MEVSYLIRYGLWHQVGRFSFDSPDLERGQTVVVRSHRGTELGEVLIKIETGLEHESAPAAPATARVLRAADGHDLDRARQRESERAGYFDLCQKVLQDREEELELIDVEPLLDERRTVLHYLGPHRLDAAGLHAAFHAAYNLDILLEPVGRDLSDEPDLSRGDVSSGCGHCGSGGGGCSSGAGCSGGAGASRESCTDCGIKRVLAERRAAISHP